MQTYPRGNIKYRQIAGNYSSGPCISRIASCWSTFLLSILTAV